MNPAPIARNAHRSVNWGRPNPERLSTPGFTGKQEGNRPGKDVAKKKRVESSGTSLFGTKERVLEVRPVPKSRRGRKPADEEVVLITREDRQGKRIGPGRVEVRRLEEKPKGRR